MRQLLPAAAIVAAALLNTPAARAADDLEARALQLATLRGEVASLQGTIAERKDALDTQLRALDAQRIDLDVQTRREELRLAQLQEELVALQTRTAGDAGLEDAVRPVVLAGIAEVRTTVGAGLPFRVDERLATLDELKRQVEAGELPPTKVLGRLWAFVEDELRLARENVIDRQVVPMPGGDVLAEVARVGMVGLYFRTSDGQVGHVARTAEGWTWTVLSDAEAIRRVELLFETLKKGIRTGWFELPWAFGEVPR